MAFTTHGWHIPGTSREFRPTYWATIRCGGPASHCVKCNIESILSNYNELDPRYSKSEAAVTSNNLQTVDLVRKPFFVTAVQVTAENMEAVAEWCGGDVRTSERGRSRQLVKCVHVKVFKTTAEWQKQARVGDWVVRAGAGYKVYNDKALKDSFDKSDKQPGPTVLETETVAYGEMLLLKDNELHPSGANCD